MLKLLEITGARRGEIANITVKSILDAEKMAFPMLYVLTLKTRQHSPTGRYIPISRHDLSFFIEYIRVNRARIIRKTCGIDGDTGFLLVNLRTGRGLRPNSITFELAILAKVAGISGHAHPHMFRHRYITKLFVALIEQYQLDTKDDFRRALMDSETLKMKILEWTGHKHLASLDRYINLAYDEVTGIAKTIDKVSQRLALDSFRANLTEIRDDVRSGIDTRRITERLLNLLTDLESDLY